ncbi:hypothetical protein OG339_12110 [Streptosporangium sp. NBC_01495]|uniref:hypothetical protein n=1 Tax=Streptosporangium sp. NBC_01495 TaxID=2903899 RepID=UPI002E322FA3|nr:hypothetical protein [Streptosporangium sp. NBC_01495]
MKGRKITGRPAKPGEKYAYPADASWPGEALAGVELQGRSVAEAARVVREHHLKVAYGLDWPLRNGDKGFRFEQLETPLAPGAAPAAKTQARPRQVRFAREMCDPGDYAARQIADEFGVTRPTVHRHLDEGKANKKAAQQAG